MTAAVDERGAEPPAVGELVDDRVGNILDRAVDQDLVVRRALAPAGLERAFDDLDPELAGARGELGRTFERDDVEPHAASTAAE